MRWRATLFATKHGEDVKILAISPQDDILFINHEDAPADFREYAEKAARGTDMSPVGYIMETEETDS